MSASHTSGKLAWDGAGRIDSVQFRQLSKHLLPDGRTYMQGLVALPYDCGDGGQEANAQRLVACWNACEGLTTEQVEQIDGLLSAKLAYQVMRRDRDVLLNAMRLIEHATAPTQDDGGHHEAAHDIATAAIAKVQS